MSTKNTDAMSKSTHKPVMAEYVWRGGKDPVDLRSKTRVLMIEMDENDKPVAPVDLPVWSYDGSSTGQASTEESEVLLNPCAVYTDPFRGSPHVLVWCDAFNGKTKEPLVTNTRVTAFKAMSTRRDSEAVLGFEQEYVVMKNGKPLDWEDSEPEKTELHYCGVNMKKRRLMDLHLQACLVAGIGMSGCNSEVMPSQMEYQVGPSDALSCCDQLWMSRYLLMRVCESDGVTVSFDARPVTTGDWNGSGCHTNFSTKEMRAEDGLEHVKAAMPKLMESHSEYVKKCGEGTEKRLTGNNETSKASTFSFGVGDRSASVRIPLLVDTNKCGYFEDRRPSANVDPYEVCALLLEALCESAEQSTEA